MFRFCFILAKNHGYFPKDSSCSVKIQLVPENHVCPLYLFHPYYQQSTWIAKKQGSERGTNDCEWDALAVTLTGEILNDSSIQVRPVNDESVGNSYQISAAEILITLKGNRGCCMMNCFVGESNFRSFTRIKTANMFKQFVNTLLYLSPLPRSHLQRIL